MSRQPITIGVQLGCHRGDMSRLREQWIAAETLGADRLWASDHLHAMVIDQELLNSANDGTHSSAMTHNVFEGTTVQAAMAATTSRVEIGCLVHANSYRNPNMLAFVANTIDQISCGRFVLGLGTGYLKEDYDAFGYEYGTQRSRSEALARAIPIIVDRLARAIPAPARKIPLLIATTGEEVGLPLVARHADLWHVYGPLDKVRRKVTRLRELCEQRGRDPDEIEMTTFYVPDLISGPDDALDHYLDLGFKHIITLTHGPDWDLTRLHELLEWRDSLHAAAAPA